MTRVLVTGATGFLGRYVVTALSDAGYDVHTLVRSGHVAEVSNTQCHVVDTTSAEEVGRVFETVRPTLVVHLASHFVAQHQTSDIPKLVASNVLLPALLLEACVASGVAFVSTGTAWEHFGEEGRECVNLYAATKRAQSELIDWYASARQLRAITLQLFDTYGPNDTRRKIVQLLIDSASSRQSLDLSPGEQRLVLVHASDVARAFCVAADRVLKTTPKGTHEVFVVDSNERVSLRELAQIVERAVGPLNVAFGARPYREREVMEPWAGGVRLPEWEPVIGLEDGIRGLVEISGRPLAHSLRS